jgi:hypothetical protein
MDWAKTVPMPFYRLLHPLVAVAVLTRSPRLKWHPPPLYFRNDKFFFSFFPPLVTYHESVINNYSPKTYIAGQKSLSSHLRLPILLSLFFFSLLKLHDDVQARYYTKMQEVPCIQMTISDFFDILFNDIYSFRNRTNMIDPNRNFAVWPMAIKNNSLRKV